MTTDNRPQKAAYRKNEATIQFKEVIDSLEEELNSKGFFINSPIWDNLSMEDMPNEQWIPVINYEGYLVSNYGRVKSVHKRATRYRKNELILRQYFDAMGYLYIVMNRKKQKVHRTVGLTFLSNTHTKEKKQINHKKGIKWYNVLFNLEWMTPGDNQRHALANGLKVAKKGEYNACAKAVNQYNLNGEFIREWGSMKQIEIALDINDAPIGKCCRGDKNYTQAYGFIWRYRKDINNNENLNPDSFNIKNLPKFYKRRETTNRLKNIA